ncbi:MAG: thioredoxin family protein [Pirellulales bacterium]
MRAFFAGLAIVALVVGCTNQTLTPIDTATPTSQARQDEQTTDRETPAESFGVGDPAPAFEGLEGVDDKRHSLKDYADAKAVVIAFICNHCPVAVAYEDRLIALQKDYADKGVQLVAINVNNMEEDKLPAMKERAEEKGFQFAYLYDPSQNVGRNFGAAVTPHVFVLDAQRRLAYVGPVDDNQDEAKVTEQYVRDAVDSVLGGKAPEATDVKPFGCSIKYE